MAYTTQADLEFAAGGVERFRELTDWNNDGVIDPDVVTRAQITADGWIDGYLRLRFGTPIASPSATLKLLAADEAIFQIRKNRGLVAITQEDLDQRTARTKELEEMRDGRLRPDDPSPAPSTAIRAVFVDNDGDISRDGTKGMW